MLHYYRTLMAWLTGASLVLVFGVVLASSVSRYAFDAPFAWSEEVAKYGMIYGTLFGSVLAYLQSSHIGFNLVHDLLSERLRLWLRPLLDLIGLAVGIALAVSGYLFMIKRGGIQSTGTGLPMYYFQAAMPVGGVCLALAALLKGARSLGVLFGRGEA